MSLDAADKSVCATSATPAARHIARPIVVLLLLPLLAFAQAPTKLQFATADIHPSPPGVQPSGGFLPAGRFETRGATLLRLIAMAYKVDTSYVSGGPEWLGSDRFDVVAKAPPRQTSQESVRQMLQSLLADRFGLVIHTEQKEMPVYLLSVIKKGPKLRKSANPTAAECPSVDGPPGMNHRECHAYTMADLSGLLPEIARNYVDRPVVDMTNIQGRYDFPLDWVGRFGYEAAKAAGGDGPVPVSIFDALEKLGLKLEPGTHPQPVIVVDSVNRYPLEYAPPAGPTEFEAAEVRPSKPGTTGSFSARNGRLDIQGFTLRQLIAAALDVKRDLVAGGPAWLDSDHYDVIAKSADVASPRAMTAMLKSLIEDRFKLKTHTEEQPVTVFALKLGKRPKLKEAATASYSECKSSLVEAGITCICRNTTMAQLVERLPDIAGAYLTRPLVNLTGLEGGFDFTLTWTPRARLAEGGLTVFDAIDAQLGLKLEEGKHPMQVIAIDHVERPEE